MWWGTNKVKRNQVMTTMSNSDGDVKKRPNMTIESRIKSSPRLSKIQRLRFLRIFMCAVTFNVVSMMCQWHSVISKYLSTTPQSFGDCSMFPRWITVTFKDLNVCRKCFNDVLMISNDFRYLYKCLWLFCEFETTCQYIGGWGVPNQDIVSFRSCERTRGLVA